jgi:hypothetical protein
MMRHCAGDDPVMRFACRLGIALSTFLAGCTQAALVKKFTPPGAESTAISYVDLLRQHNFDLIEHDLDPTVAKSDDRETLAQMAALFPEEIPESVKVVGVDLSHGQASSSTKVTLEYEFPSKWLLASVTTQKDGHVSTLEGINVYPMSDSLENLNRFTLKGKSTTQYLILVYALCSLIFSFYVFIVCIRTSVGKWKWLWMLIALVGVEKVAVNWGTGQLTFGILSIQIPCFQMSRPPYGPWTVGAFLPLGAILFLNHRRKMKISGQSVEPPGDSAN